MDALYMMIPLSLLMSMGALAACIWAIRGGQFDDVDTPALRILNDFSDDLNDLKGANEIDENKKGTQHEQQQK